jgi:hypothetical protein
MKSTNANEVQKCFDSFQKAAAEDRMDKEGRRYSVGIYARENKVALRKMYNLREGR